MKNAENQQKPRSNLSDEYRAYITSEHWRALKAELLARDEPHCECCGYRRNLQAHHLAYRRPLNSGTVDDLMLICQGCHQILHDHRTYYLTLRELPVEVKRRRVVAYVKGMKRNPVGSADVSLAWREARERNRIREWRK